jgi:hypothetical protein
MCNQADEHQVQRELCAIRLMNIRCSASYVQHSSAGWPVVATLRGRSQDDLHGW